MPDHNSAGEWAAQRLPPGWHLPIQHETRQTPQLPVLLGEQQAERERERLLERLEKRLLELLAIQLRLQPTIQVEIQLVIQVKTQVFVQASTRLRILLQVFPGELLRILRSEHQREERAVRAAVAG
jgi:hypothetical protein